MNRWKARIATAAAGTICLSLSVGQMAAAENVAVPAGVNQPAVPVADRGQSPVRANLVPADVGSADHGLNGDSVPLTKEMTVKKMVDEALLLLRSNRNEQAAMKLKQAVELDPQSASAHHNYGLALAKLGDTSHAIIQLNKAFELNPQSDASLLTLAGLQQSIGHVDEAIALYNQFLTKFGSDPRLKVTATKIQQLVAGLSSEKKEIDQVRHDTAKLEPVDAGGAGVLQVPAQLVLADDYLAEATRKGILRWPNTKMPIRVLIHTAENNVKVVDSSAVRGVPYYKKQWRDILVRSFNDWQKASNDLVKFQIVQPGSEYDVECYFVSDDHRDAGLHNDAEAGEAKMLMDSNGLAKGKIYILTKSLSSVLPLTDNRMRVICLHEIGHALGLAGHTDNPEDIMFYSTSFKDEWRDLTARDARTIQRLYSSN